MSCILSLSVTDRDRRELRGVVILESVEFGLDVTLHHIPIHHPNPGWPLTRGVSIHQHIVSVKRYMMLQVGDPGEGQTWLIEFGSYVMGNVLVVLVVLSIRNSRDEVKIRARMSQYQNWFCGSLRERSTNLTSLKKGNTDTQSSKVQKIDLESIIELRALTDNQFRF